MRVVETVPDIGNMEVGEFLYDSTNDVIVLRLVTGLVTFAKD
ncbi:MAG: hypothetical protein ACFFG0_03075 [Candidatus Thorarchaeota archaeon]